MPLAAFRYHHSSTFSDENLRFQDKTNPFHTLGIKKKKATEATMQCNTIETPVSPNEAKQKHKYTQNK